MKLAVLLPHDSVEHVARLLPEVELDVAKSYGDLHMMVRATRYDWVLVDPQAYGDETQAAVEILAKNPQLRVSAYVRLVPPSLRAVLILAQHGLEHVFVHPVRSSDPVFQNAVQNIAAVRFAVTVLTAISPLLEDLPPSVREALLDLFKRPYRVDSVYDLATEAGMRPRALYRVFAAAELGTPRQLIDLAKAIHGYFHLSQRNCSVGAASKRVGYSNAPTFSRHFRRHVGVQPSSIRLRDHSDELLLTVIESLFKPKALRNF